MKDSLVNETEKCSQLQKKILMEKFWQQSLVWPFKLGHHGPVAKVGKNAWKHKKVGDSHVQLNSLG